MDILISDGYAPYFNTSTVSAVNGVRQAQKAGLEKASVSNTQTDTSVTGSNMGLKAAKPDELALYLSPGEKRALLQNFDNDASLVRMFDPRKQITTSGYVVSGSRVDTVV